MESASPAASDGPEIHMTAGLNSRVMALEAIVSKLNLAYDEVKKRLDEVQQFSEDVAGMQVRKFSEIEENAQEQRRLFGEMRTQLQSLQNSRVNHKDVLVRHENQSKKLIELVNEVSEKQHEAEMQKEWANDARARRFSTFEGQEQRVRGEELYEIREGKRGGSQGSRGGSQGSRHHHHRRVQSFPVERERRKPSARRFTDRF